MANHLVTVVGGTGFVGQALVSALLRQGYDVQVLARHASEAKGLFPATASAGRLLLKNADITQPKTLHDALEGSFAVINLVGILFERGRQRFSSIHNQCAERLAKMAKEAGVQRFIHLSALGVHQAKSSHYAKSKVGGEQAVLNAFPKATILSPSVIFGPKDNFINQFNQMAAMAPALPLIGGGKTKFQPVYVGDVAEAMLQSLENEKVQGKVLELGGPKTYSFREILELILELTGRKRALVNLPWGVAGAIGFAGEFAPTPPLTRDQVRLLKYDNVVSKDGFQKLGITPQPMELIISQYLPLAKALSEPSALNGMEEVKLAA